MIKLLELFGGVGACTKAFERLGIEFQIADYVEIDKYAVASYNAIHGTDFKPQDIRFWDKDIEVDFIMHGSPCQDFSLAGKQLGGDENSGTRSSLMYETLRIVEKLKPKYVVWENVRNVLSERHRHNFNNYLNRMESLGYKNTYGLLNALDYGIPQNRVRMFTISVREDLGFEFVIPQKEELTIKLKDLLEQETDAKFFLSDEQIDSLKAGETTDDCLHIKNATKKGYLEAFVGDSVFISYPNSTTRRARVGRAISHTLQTLCTIGVVVQ